MRGDIRQPGEMLGAGRQRGTREGQWDSVSMGGQGRCPSHCVRPAAGSEPLDAVFTL